VCGGSVGAGGGWVNGSWVNGSNSTNTTIGTGPGVVCVTQECQEASDAAHTAEMAAAQLQAEAAAEGVAAAAAHDAEVLEEEGEVLSAKAEVAMAMAAASKAEAAAAAACANVTKVETAVAAEHSAGIDASAIEAVLVQAKKDCDTAKALAKNLTAFAEAANVTAMAKAHNETAIQIRKERYEAEMVKKQIAEQLAYDAAMDADIAINTANAAAQVNTTKNFTATLHAVAVIKPGHEGPLTDAEQADIIAEVIQEVADVGEKDGIGDAVTAEVEVGDVKSKAAADAEEIIPDHGGAEHGIGGSPPPPAPLTMVSGAASPPPGPLTMAIGASPPPGPLTMGIAGASPPPGPLTMGYDGASPPPAPATGYPTAQQRETHRLTHERQSNLKEREAQLDRREARIVAHTQARLDNNHGVLGPAAVALVATVAERAQGNPTPTPTPSAGAGLQEPSAEELCDNMTPSTPVVVLQEKLISAKATALVLEAVDLPIEEKGKCTSAVCFCLTKLIDIATDQDDDGEVNQSNEYESDANNPASPWGNSNCCKKVDGKSVHQGPGSIFGEYCTGIGACLRIEADGSHSCEINPGLFPTETVCNGDVSHGVWCQGHDCTATAAPTSAPTMAPTAAPTAAPRPRPPPRPPQRPRRWATTRSSR